MITMYKPTLKRNIANQPNISQGRKGNESGTREEGEDHVASRMDSSHLMVPGKLLDKPGDKHQEGKHLITPLIVRSHKYPKRVSQMIGKEVGESSRGIGGYRELNWFYKGDRILLWISDKEILQEIVLQNEINCVSMGQLKGSGIPSKLKNKYILALALKNTVQLYSINNYTLDYSQSGVRYQLKSTIQVEKVKWVQNNKLIMVGNSGIMEIIEFGLNQCRKKMDLSFFRKYLPARAEEGIVKLEQLAYTQKWVFVLRTQIKKKGWLKNIVDSVLEGDTSEFVKQRYVQVYEITPQKIIKRERVTQEALTQNIRISMPSWDKPIEINSIYISRHGDKEGELGIVTDCGCFLSIRNHIGNFSRQPLFVPKVDQLGQCQLITSKKLQNHQETAQKQAGKVISSLGYDNLTLMEDSLMWIGDQRIDGILSSQVMGQITQNSYYHNETLVKRSRNWLIYTFQNYFTVSQFPIRHFIALLFYFKGNLSNQFLGYQYKEEKFNIILEKYITVLGYSTFLKYLIELVMSQERYVSVNPFLLELIEQQLKEEKSKHVKDWRHQLSASAKVQQFHLDQKIMQSIWQLILELQYRNSYQGNLKVCSVYESNTYWLTMHTIYHNLISPAYSMTPDHFKESKAQIEDLLESLKLIDQFCSQKMELQKVIRSSFMMKLDNNSFNKFNDLDNTDCSFMRQNQLGWLSEPAKRSIATKSLNEHHLVIQEKLRTAFKATAVFLTIYYNLEEYVYKVQGIHVNSYTKETIPPFKELLRSRDHQQQIKKILINTVDHAQLVELDRQLPLFDINRELQFVRCKYKIKTEERKKEQVDFDQLAKSMSSHHFGEVQQLFEDRLDLKLKALGLYQQKIFKDKKDLIPSNTLRQRSYMSRTYFPQDEEQILKHKRTTLDKELDLTVDEEKSTIARAVSQCSQMKEDNIYKISSVIDQIIMLISNKPYLIYYMEEKLREKSLIKELGQLQRIKPKNMGDGKTIRKEEARREVFPRSSYF